MSFGSSISINQYSPCNTALTPGISSTTAFTTPFIAGSIFTYTLSTTPLTVGFQTATFTVGFTAATKLTSIGSIEVDFPNWYTIGNTASTVNMLNTGVNSCSSS